MPKVVKVMSIIYSNPPGPGARTTTTEVGTIRESNIRMTMGPEYMLERGHEEYKGMETIKVVESVRAAR